MNPNPMHEEAAMWLARHQDEGMDWEGFTLWLEADARHRLAYDELALIDRAIEHSAAPLLREISKEEQSPAARKLRTRWARTAGLGGGALAAGLGALLWLVPQQGPIALKDYKSRPGETVRIGLVGGGNVLLAPASHLVIQGSKISLQGSALFDIPHQPGRTLKISAGDFDVSDIGTRFTIENDPEAVIIELAEGSLAVSSDRLPEPISLSRGKGLIADPVKGTVRLTSIEPQLVGSWRSGKLEFDNAPLALVARQISRYSGEQVTVDPEIADQPFSGVIAVNHGEAPEQSLAQILSLEVKRVGGTVRLEPHRN